MSEENTKTDSNERKLHIVVAHVWSDGSAYSFAKTLPFGDDLAPLFNFMARGNGSSETVAAQVTDTREEAEDLAQTWNETDRLEGRLHEFPTQTEA